MLANNLDYKESGEVTSPQGTGGSTAGVCVGLRDSALIRFITRVTSLVIVRYLRPTSFKVRTPYSSW
jgi:hypothetical protein